MFLIYLLSVIFAARNGGSMPFRVEVDITGSDGLARCILVKWQAPSDCLANA